MKKASIVLPQGTVINVPAGTHANVIKDGNTYYIPFLTIEGSTESDGDDEPDPEPKAKKVSAPVEKAAPPVAEKATKKVAPTPKPVTKVEDDAPDFASMSSDELLEFAQENGLDLAKYKKDNGISRLKGTTLIKAVKELYAAIESDDEDEEAIEDEQEEAPSPAKGGAVTAEKVVAILQKYEDEKLDESGMKKALTVLSTAEIATEFTKEFLMNANLTLEEAADLFLESIAPKAKATKAEAPKGKRGSKPKYEDVEDINDLEVGDKVSVFWSEEEYNDTYTGHVSAVKKGKKGADNTVTIIYDEDGEAVVFDAEIHADVKRLVA